MPNDSTPTLNDFGWALAQLKEGNIVTRAGWNGQGQHVALAAPKSSHWIMLDDNVYRKITTYAPYFLLYTTAEVYQPGWVPSVSDTLAEDWKQAALPIKDKDDTNIN